MTTTPDYAGLSRSLGALAYHIQQTGTADGQDAQTCLEVAEALRALLESNAALEARVKELEEAIERVPTMKQAQLVAVIPAPQPSGPVGALADALRGLLKAYENAFDWTAELPPETAEAERIANEVLEALTSSKPEQAVPSGWVAVPQSALNWLFGTGPDADGNWFGDTARETKGRYWWRSHFRRLISPAAPTAGGGDAE